MSRHWLMFDFVKILWPLLLPLHCVCLLKRCLSPATTYNYCNKMKTTTAAVKYVTEYGEVTLLLQESLHQVKSWLAADREKIDKSWFQEKNSKYLPKISQMFLSFINFPIKFISASTWVSRKCEPVCWVLAGHDTSLSTVTRDTCPHRRHDHWSPDVMFPGPSH